MPELTALKAMALGLIQGVGEFLPISSSGHLMLARRFFGLPDVEQMKAFDVLLHLATLLAIVIFFRHDLRRAWEAWLRRKGDADARWSRLILVAMAPTGLLALSLAHPIDALFARCPWLVGAMLILAGTQNFLAAQRLNSGRNTRRMEQLTVRQALGIGFGQGLAVLFHGISRSGTTMFCGSLCGLDRESAPRFSFLMAIPAIACAALVEVPKLFTLETPPLGSMVLGSLVAAVVGYGALSTVFRVVRAGRLGVFAWYCWTVGILAVLILGRGA